MANAALARYQGMSMSKLAAKYNSLQKLKERVNEKSESIIEGVVRTVEVQGAAFIFGAVQGAWYDPRSATDKPGAHWFGFPVEAVVGIGLHMGALLGFGGKHSNHLQNFADGALAAYVANLGRGWGYKFWKEREAKKASGSTSGDIREEIASLLDS